MNSSQELTPKRLVLPKGDINQLNEIESFNSFIIVGANGSGKTRIGAWLEMNGPQKEIVHRIAAQRSLVFPTDSTPIGLKNAKQSFLWAEIPSNWDENTFERNKLIQKIQRKYGGAIIGSENSPVNDFSALLTFLLSDNYASLQSSESEFYETGQPVKIKQTKLRRLKEIWEQILPHRKMKFNASDVTLQTDDTGVGEYNAKAMSDGERVIFYLIGQIISADDNAIILIDEPEIHIHKAVQDKLWQLLESERNDCTFVYLTHDLDFASSRQGSQKIFMKSYNGQGFDWDLIPDDGDLPEAMLLQLIGSRKPVIFVEGDISSKDLEIYKLTYPEFLVKPVGGCADVILSTKAFRRLKPLHQLDCYGIIDRDYLIDGQLASYEKSGIYTINVAEIENLFLVPELIRIVAKQFLLDERKTLSKIEDYVISNFKRNIEEHAINVTKHMITLHLGRFSSGKEDITSLTSEYSTHAGNFDPINEYNSAKNSAEKMISNRDYIGILKVYNKKELTNNISHLFDLKGGDSSYLNKIREMNRQSLIDLSATLSSYIPSF